MCARSRPVTASAFSRTASEEFAVKPPFNRRARRKPTPNGACLRACLRKRAKERGERLAFDISTCMLVCSPQRKKESKQAMASPSPSTSNLAIAQQIDAARRRADGLREQIWKKKDALNDGTRTPPSAPFLFCDCCCANAHRVVRDGLRSDRDRQERSAGDPRPRYSAAAQPARPPRQSLRAALVRRQPTRCQVRLDAVN